MISDTLIPVAIIFAAWSIALTVWVWWARGEHERIRRRNLLAHRSSFIRRI